METHEVMIKTYVVGDRVSISCARCSKPIVDISTASFGDKWLDEVILGHGEECKGNP